MKQLTTAQTWAISIIVAISICVMSAIDLYDQQLAHENMVAMRNIERAELKAQQRQYNDLAARGEYMTGVKSKQ